VPLDEVAQMFPQERTLVRDKNMSGHEVGPLPLHALLVELRGRRKSGENDMISIRIREILLGCRSSLELARQTLADRPRQGSGTADKMVLLASPQIIGPALTGFVLQHTENFVAPFAITAAICVDGSLA
jgi:hypothetical protein